ncbi:MAG TPA: hypothetical protein VNC84_00300 [Gammaproteobacteria bacterium]|jgi:hypothetical protein|nr:hypothetical protein [Gammaproteobacteria bacterium]
MFKLAPVSDTSLPAAAVAMPAGVQQTQLSEEEIADIRCRLVQAELLSDHAMILLNLATYLAPDKIPIAVLIGAKIDFDAIVHGIAALKSYGFITCSSNDTVTHHDTITLVSPSTQLFMQREHEHMPTQRLDWLNALVGALDHFLSRNTIFLGGNPTIYLSHALRCAEHIERLRH